MPLYPGDAPLRIYRARDLDRGDAFNLTFLEIGAHTGTHIDAPLHFIRGGGTVDRLDLNVLIGPAQVVDMRHVRDAIGAQDLEDAHIPPDAQRLLFKTRNAELWYKRGFQEDYVAFSDEGAKWLVGHGAQLVAIDYLSAEMFGASEPIAHLALLGAGVIVVEGVILDEAEAGAYQLVCLPLKVQGAEGAPARAVLIRE